jgi:long-chain acyl-CoA synthetase
MEINKVVKARNLKSIREMIDQLDDDRMNKPALTMLENGKYRSLSYGEMQKKIRFLANALLKIGIRKGDHIGLISENRNKWIITYLAVTYIGAIIVPFDKELHQDELTHIIRSSDVKYMFSSKSYLKKIKKAFEFNKNIKKIILFDFHDILNHKKSISVIKKILKKDNSVSMDYKKEWKNLTMKESKKDTPFMEFEYLHIDSLFLLGNIMSKNNENLYENVDVDKEEIAAIIYTSGTTGLPKGVMLTHRNLVSNGDAIQQTTETYPDDNWIIILPLHHTFPAIAGIFVPILTYANITTVATIRSDVMIKTMRETEVSIFPTVPVIVEKMYKKILSNVRMEPFF